MRVHMCMFTNACRCLQNNWQNDSWISKTSFLTVYTYLYKPRLKGAELVCSLVGFQFLYCQLAIPKIMWTNVTKIQKKNPRKQKVRVRTWVADQLFPREKPTLRDHRVVPFSCSHHASHTLCTNTKLRQNPIHNIGISTTMHALMFFTCPNHRDIEFYIYVDNILFFLTDLLKLHIF